MTVSSGATWHAHVVKGVLVVHPPWHVLDEERAALPRALKSTNSSSIISVGRVAMWDRGGRPHRRRGKESTADRLCKPQRPERAHLPRER